jgi:RNA polymerase sigma-70 factor (ECF subfamily)
MAAVGAAELTAQDRRDDSPGTLGDVLYADKSKTRVSEKDWVGLVQSIAAGDQLALHALYERAHRPVFTLIMRINGNRETAEELTLDVFYDVWQRASRYDVEGGTVLGWIMNQARSRAIDRLRFERRKKRVDPHASDPLLAIETASTHDALEFKQHSGLLKAALSVLTRDERQVIEAAFFSELTYAEVAARFNQPVGTVKTRIRSGLHKLRQALATEAKKP